MRQRPLCQGSLMQGSPALQQPDGTVFFGSPLCQVLGGGYRSLVSPLLLLVGSPSSQRCLRAHVELIQKFVQEGNQLVVIHLSHDPSHSAAAALHVSPEPSIRCFLLGDRVSWESHHILLAISISQNILQSISFVNEEMKTV